MDKTEPGSPSDPVDLTNCDREPIHTPGGVQPHGVLMALEGPALTVAQVSANTSDLLGVPADRLLGRPAEELFEPAGRADLADTLRSAQPRDAGPLRVRAAGREFDALAHRHD